MRFYDIDGIEIDVQNPGFFIDKKALLDLQEAIQEMLSYV